MDSFIFVHLKIVHMCKMTDILREYLAKSSDEQLAKDLEELKGFNEFGVDVMSFLYEQYYNIFYNIIHRSIIVKDGIDSNYENDHDSTYYLAA